eukprot:gene21644-27684_t
MSALSVKTPIKNVIYPAMLKTLYGINAGLKKDGILAPAGGSLYNTKRLYDLIGQPLDNIPTIHIGGTNGKGTTSFKVSECLRLSGYKTGLFVSPHLASFRERVQVDAQLIPEDNFVEHLKTLLELCAQHDIKATEFELTFLLASMHFRHSNCQAVVLEVGCGGLFDATNVVSTAVSVICSVSLDHTRILGSTVEAIGGNKAGIFRRDRPALVGPNVDTLRSVQETALQSGAHLFSFRDAWRHYADKHWIPNDARSTLTDDPHLVVDTDLLNSELSLLALCMLREYSPSFSTLDVGSEAVREGLARRPPCRWEIFSHVVRLSPPPASSSAADNLSGEVAVTAVLDMGHNPAAISALCRRIQRDYADKHVRVVYAMSRDKDVRSCLRTVLSAVPHSHIHFIQSANFRAVSRDDLNALFREETDGEEMTPLKGDNIQEALQSVFDLAAQDALTPGDQGGRRDSVVIVCGTGYVMPEARAFLGVVEPRDSVDLLRSSSV